MIAKFAKYAEFAQRIDRKRAMTCGATLLIAGAAGHFVQNGPSAAPQVVAAGMVVPVPAVPAPAVLAEAESKPVAEPETIAIETVAAIAPETPEQAAPIEEVTRAESEAILSTPALQPEVVAEARVKLAALGEFGDLANEPAAPSAEELAAGCDIAVTATAAPAAMVSLTVDAPCKSGEEVAFDHSGLRFSDQLGPDGNLTMTVPAMTKTAVISVQFEDGQEKATDVAVPDFGEFERVALVWQGATGLQLHVLEGGATYGEAGHIWADTPGLPTRAVDGEGGFLSVLGSTADGFAADVYTYPAHLMDAVEPDVSIEAQVMENTCGGKINGFFLRSTPNGEPVLTDVGMSVPGCDAVGEFLVLKNLPQDLKIARN